MLTFEDDFVAPTANPMLQPATAETIRAHASGSIAHAI